MFARSYCTHRGHAVLDMHTDIAPLLAMIRCDPPAEASLVLVMLQAGPVLRHVCVYVFMCVYMYVHVCV